ncbi:hypothetical protein SAV31267_039860 [Streptomyces avermitilis]|uniref:Uncharacterized protein n=1 Tax=Streptomyces avermitilis TaxID=33903 RepID=A0A4D4MQV3_STRAX|nr:hypothetical protein SAVMC3_59040 [Streptomyces avermitilis]GDY74501.1 hypothetical protein SAV31267_039860 [Streptomyces avermitilis]
MCLAGDPPARWRTRADMGGVRRAVVKIYHGRNIGRPGRVWHTPQEEADKDDLIDP